MTKDKIVMTNAFIDAGGQGDDFVFIRNIESIEHDYKYGWRIRMVSGRMRAITDEIAMKLLQLNF